MLNQDLIKQFKHIKANTMTGVLQLQDDGRAIRFYFEDGSLLLLDFGVDKELMMANQFSAHHMIDDAMLQYAKTSYQDNQTPVAETLLKQQLVSQGEVDQVTRGMVEEILCHAFSNQHQTSWQNEADVDITSFDLNKTAVKIRIDIDMLLTMVQSRVQEREAVQQRLSDFNTIYSFTEDAPPDAQLNDMERNVLHFVDGRQSVKDIARSMRETAVNVGIYLCSLENQGFIRQGGIRQSTQLSVSQDSASAAADPFESAAQEQEPAAAATDRQDGADAGNFEVYSTTYTRQEQGSNVGSIILMLFVLVALVVGWLVWDGIQTAERMEERKTEMMARIIAGQWGQAEELLEDIYDEASGDQAERQRIDRLADEIRQGFIEKMDKIESLISEKDTSTVQKELEYFPASASVYTNLWTSELATRLATLQSEGEVLEEEIDSAATSYRQRVDNMLRSNNIELAMSEISEPTRGYSQAAWDFMTQRAKAAIERWRSETLDEVSVSGLEKSYKWKFLQLNNVKKAQPTERESAIIEQLETRLKEEQGELLKRLTDVPALLASGNYKGAEQLLVLLEENSMALPEEKRDQVAVLTQEKNALKEELTRSETVLRNNILAGQELEQLERARKNVNDHVNAYPAVHNRSYLQQLVATADLIIEAVKSGLLDDELAALEAVDLEQETIVGELLEQRIETLSIINKSATNKLDYIRKLAREGSIPEALVELRAFVNDPTNGRTVAYAEATELLKHLEEQQKENEILYAEFQKAILSDDVATVSSLLPKIKRKELPFVVSSVPSGASIFLNGEDTGEVTPKMYPPSSNAERADMVFELHKDGYRVTRITPFEVESSWRVRAIMQRKPVVELNLEESVNSNMAVINDELWLSSNKSIWRISKDGSTKSYELQNKASTIYGAPAQSTIDNAVYVPTLDRVIYKVTEEGDVITIPASSSSDRAVVHYVSPVMIDAELIVSVSAANGDVHALNESNAALQWKTEGPDRAAAPPVLVNDRLLVMYRNGQCKTLDVNNGDEIHTAAFGEPVLSAWAGDGIIFAYTPRHLISWNGEQISSEPLFKIIVNGGPGVIRTKDNRIRVPDAQGRFNEELGRITEDLTAQPLLWNGHAVCPVGNTMHIIGPRGFSIEAEKPMLAPVIFGELLVIASSDGQIRFLKQ